jgi:hypothetical protein
VHRRLTGALDTAMSSFNTMLKSLDPASADDIEAYRAWLEKHAPIEAAEARFLERKNDLLAVSRPRAASAEAGASASASAAGSVGGVGPHQRAAIGLPLIAVLPLMAFAIVPSLLGRLFIVTLIGTAEVMVVTSSEVVDLMTQREWFLCASV